METSLRPQRPATILSRTTTHSTPLQVLGQLGKPSLPVLSVIHYQAQLCGVTDMQGTAVTGRLVMNSGKTHWKGNPTETVPRPAHQGTKSLHYQMGNDFQNIASLISHQRVGCHVKEWLQASASASELSPVSPRLGTPHALPGAYAPINLDAEAFAGARLVSPSEHGTSSKI